MVLHACFVCALDLSLIACLGERHGVMVVGVMNVAWYSVTLLNAALRLVCPAPANTSMTFIDSHKKLGHTVHGD